MDNLGRTQRDIIRDHNQRNDWEETQLKTFSRGESSEKTLAADDVNVEFRQSTTDKEKRRYCLPKCLLLAVCLLALLGGIVILIYFESNKDDPDRGDILTTAAPPDECPDIYVLLGSVVEINCAMNDPIPGYVDAVYSNQLVAASDNFTCVSTGDNDDRRNVSCRATARASCGVHGDVIVHFYDGFGNNKQVQFTKIVKVRVLDFDNSASIRQVYSDSTSTFHLECEYTGFCTRHEVGFYGRDNTTLADSMQCTSSYSNRDGYNVRCEATVSSHVIYDYGNGAELYCGLMSEGVTQVKIELELPQCDDISTDPNCSDSTTTLFDCMELSSVTESCKNTCSVARTCFPSRLKEIISTTCTPLVLCVLDWCRYPDTREIDSSAMLPYGVLCGNSDQTLPRN